MKKLPEDLRRDRYTMWLNKKEKTTLASLHPKTSTAVQVLIKKYDELTK